MASNIKVSKFRQTRATVWKPDTHVLDVKPTGAIWDCANFLAANSKYIAVPWSSPGSTAVFTHDIKGKLPSSVPLITGHAAPVIDVAFHPFNEQLLFTASEDGLVKGWQIPEAGLPASGLDTARVTLQGHAKKVGILTWHPSASNVLATVSADNNIGLWDVEVEKPQLYLKNFEDSVLSCNFNLDGSLINTTTKDKKVSIVDSRSGALVASSIAHAGSKTHRSVWAKRRNLIVTVGFNKQQYRQLMVWDARNFATPVHTEEIDQQSSVTMPFMDEDTNMLYLAGKGDGSIRYYELWDEQVPITYLAAYQATDPQKGLAMLPKRSMDVRSCEVARFVKLASNAKSLQTISFHLPRKSSEIEFQRDVYPPTFAWTPAATAADFFGAGRNVAPLECDMRAVFDAELPEARVATPTFGGSPTSGTPASPAGQPAAQAADVASPVSPPTPPVSPATSFPAEGTATKTGTPPFKPATPPAKPVTPVTPVAPVAPAVAPASTAVANQEAIVAYLRAQLSHAEADLLRLRQQAAAAGGARGGRSAAVEASSSDDEDVV